MKIFRKFQKKLQLIKRYHMLSQTEDELILLNKELESTVIYSNNKDAYKYLSEIHARYGQTIINRYNIMSKILSDDEKINFSEKSITSLAFHSKISNLYNEASL